jgi:hypothetical protein
MNTKTTESKAKVTRSLTGGLGFETNHFELVSRQGTVVADHSIRCIEICIEDQLKEHVCAKSPQYRILANYSAFFVKRCLRQKICDVETESIIFTTLDLSVLLRGSGPCKSFRTENLTLIVNSRRVQSSIQRSG